MTHIKCNRKICFVAKGHAFIFYLRQLLTTFRINEFNN